ncbi:hypothetical protein P1X14_18145 [Sphingomonas sp. AOB5]|uniref:surface-adhesin E family protein n=1 Tax=Sphingomonas sp. AOB5 TaxID=3034017 RepID=UPI0023F7F1A5|nr:surface-adhesin E family protein [Sphingomonas sp. AOB5]MDF7777186.1 hypothetical protein [Sphingomonas sp. AOB5]
MLRTALIAFGILVAPAAQARDWWLMTVEKDEGRTVFVDLQSPKDAGEDIRSIDILMVFEQDRAGAAAGIVNISLGCKAPKARINGVTRIDTSGKPNGTEPTDTEWGEVSPGSNFADLADLACGRRKLDTKSYGDGLPIVDGRALLQGGENAK